MKSKIEEFCKSAFQIFLEHFNYQEVFWKEVEKQAEPPDYYLWIDGKQYAIEVTSLMEQVDSGGRQLPMQSVNASFRKLVEQVKENAIQKGILHGAYGVSFNGPIEQFGRVEKQVHQDLLAYIEATQYISSAPKTLIFKRGRQKVSIQKMNDRRNFVSACQLGAKRQGEMVEDFSSLIEERINTKQEKLKDILFPVILLLYDAYLFADKEEHISCLDKVSNLSCFNTVFLVPNDAPGMILHSDNPSWIDCVTIG